MRKLFACLILATVAVAAPASAKKKPTGPYCIPHKAGFKASGTLVSSSLTQTAGADTAKRGDDRWSGDLVVTVKKANHGAPTGEQTYTLNNARVRFHPRNDTTIAAGDRVKVSGKLSKFGKKCTAGETITTVKKADIKAAK
jgi:hypothetical protein